MDNDLMISRRILEREDGRTMGAYRYISSSLSFFFSSFL